MTDFEILRKIEGKQMNVTEKDIRRLIGELKKQHDIYWEKTEKLPQNDWFDSYYNGVATGFAFAVDIVNEMFFDGPKSEVYE